MAQKWADKIGLPFSNDVKSSIAKAVAQDTEGSDTLGEGLTMLYGWFLDDDFKDISVLSYATAPPMRWGRNENNPPLMGHWFASLVLEPMQQRNSLSNILPLGTNSPLNSLDRLIERKFKKPENIKDFSLDTVLISSLILQRRNAYTPMK